MHNSILILSDDKHDTENLLNLLDQKEGGEFNVECLTKLSSAIVRLKNHGIDAIILDLLLPDSYGIETFDQLFASAPHISIVILSETDEEVIAKKAVEHGAKAYLSQGHFIGNIVPLTLRNIIQSKKTEANFYQEKERAEIALNSIGDAVICTNLLGQINYLNIAAEKMTGWTKEESNGQPIEKVFKIVNRTTRQPPEHNPVYLALEQDQVKGLRPDTVLLCKDGSEVSIEDSSSPIHNWDGKITGAVVVFHDVTEALSMTMKMAHLAQHDFLTNLPNRVLLNDRVSQAINHSERSNSQFALLFLDLDNFKNINDLLGHAVGDELLKSVAERLIHCVRKCDTVSRQGGDEFLILLAECVSADDASIAADKILAELNHPHFITDRNLHITCSIGISVYPKDGLDADTLIKSADSAMYLAKEKGDNNYQFCTDEMNRNANQRLTIETNLRFSLDHHELMLLYQPKINLKNGEIVGVEALLRSTRRELLNIAPKHLIKVAEDCGLIVPLGRWVIREACFQAKKWLASGTTFGSVAVNVSVIEFHQKNFISDIKATLKDTHLEPCYLELEITESVLMNNVESSRSLLNELKNLGIKLAVDDFGTGYSSLSYLKLFPLNVLKIDQSFVSDITSSSDTNIISAIVSMGKGLKLKVIAEGIETKSHLAFLQALDCEDGQGFLFSPPISANEFAKLSATKIKPWLHLISQVKTPAKVKVSKDHQVKLSA